MSNEKSNRLPVGVIVFGLALFLGVFVAGFGFGILAFVFDLGRQGAAATLVALFL